MVLIDRFTLLKSPFLMESDSMILLIKFNEIIKIHINENRSQKRSQNCKLAGSKLPFWLILKITLPPKGITMGETSALLPFLGLSAPNESIFRVDKIGCFHIKD